MMNWPAAPVVGVPQFFDVRGEIVPVTTPANPPGVVTPSVPKGYIPVPVIQPTSIFNVVSLLPESCVPRITRPPGTILLAVTEMVDAVALKLLPPTVAVNDPLPPALPVPVGAVELHPATRANSATIAGTRKHRGSMRGGYHVGYTNELRELTNPVF